MSKEIQKIEIGKPIITKDLSLREKIRLLKRLKDFKKPIEVYFCRCKREGYITKIEKTHLLLENEILNFWYDIPVSDITKVEVLDYKETFNPYNREVLERAKEEAEYYYNEFKNTRRLSEDWEQLESKLKEAVLNYRRLIESFGRYYKKDLLKINSEMAQEYLKYKRFHAEFYKMWIKKRKWLKKKGIIKNNKYIKR